MSSRINNQETAFVSTGWLYVLEMLLKIYAYGFENYWGDGQNRFDFIVTLVIGRLYSSLSIIINHPIFKFFIFLLSDATI